MTPGPTLIEQLEALKKALAPLNWKDTVPDDLQSEVRMLFNEALAGGPDMNGDAGPTLTPNHAYDCILATERIATLQGSAALPIPMLLYCPQCGQAHVDEPDERTPDWTNPPHRSHLCHDCGCIWRPADVPTTGVAAIETQGKADTWTAERGNAESAMRATTPTAPDQDTGASVPDQALAVPVEPVARLDPSGFDPSRCVLTYALALIAEECAEATQFIGKALRFGFDTPGAPETPFNGDTVRTNLPKELGDIRAAIRFAAAHGFVDEAAVKQAEDRKFAKLLNPASRDNLGRQLAPLPAIATVGPKPWNRVRFTRART